MLNQKAILLFKIILWIICFNFLNPPVLSEPLQQNKKTEMAVLPLRTPQGVITTETSELTNWIIFKIFNLGIKDVLEQQDIEKILSSDNLINFNSCFSDSCMYAAGSKLQVKKVIWGTVGTEESLVTLKLFLGDVNEKKVLNRITSETKGSINDLPNRLSVLLSSLLSYDIDTSQSTVSKQPIPELGTIELNSKPEGAQVTINGEKIGTTPFKQDSLRPGRYDITIDLHGYKQFSKTVLLSKGAHKKLLVKLVTRYGSLAVLCTPKGASVILDNTDVGKTPFYSDTVEPGVYNLKLTLPEYVTFTMPVTITRSKSEMIKATLVSKAFADSLKLAKKKQRRIARRIVFGTLAAGFTALGIYTNYEVDKALDDEKEAYNNYNRDGLSASQYQYYYDIYEGKVDETDDLALRRNVFYIIGGVFGIGFAISIPF